MADLRAEVDRDVIQKWCLLRAKDIDGLTNLYTEDCKYMIAGGPTIEGKADIKKYYQQVFAGEVVPADGKMVLEELEIGPAGGDLVFVTGPCESFKSDGTSMDKVRFLAILKRVDGKFRIHCDMDNRENKL